MGSYPDGIWIHHTAGHDHKGYDSAIIREDHIKNRHWDDIGYHYVIEQINGIYQITTGRGLEWQGSHVRSHNNSIGIAIVGNFDLYPPTKQAMDKLEQLLLGLLVTFKLSPDDIHFHNEASNKTCPGLLFPEQQLLQDIRKAVKNGYVK